MKIYDVSVIVSGQDVIALISYSVIINNVERFNNVRFDLG